MGKWCLHASSFIFYQIVIKVAGNQDRHKSSDEFDFGPLVSMAHLYVFEMRFDLGTLDSGERSLPFGLLVYIRADYVSGYGIVSLASEYPETEVRADHEAFSVCSRPTDPKKLPVLKHFYWSA